MRDQPPRNWRALGHHPVHRLHHARPPRPSGHATDFARWFHGAPPPTQLAGTPAGRLTSTAAPAPTPATRPRLSALYSATVRALSASGPTRRGGPPGEHLAARPEYVRTYGQGYTANWSRPWQGPNARQAACTRPEQTGLDRGRGPARGPRQVQLLGHGDHDAVGTWPPARSSSPQVTCRRQLGPEPSPCPARLTPASPTTTASHKSGLPDDAPAQAARSTSRWANCSMASRTTRARSPASARAL